MAKTTKKSTSKKSSAPARSANGGAKKKTAAKKRPIRREVGGIVCLVLMLCVLVSYFGVDALLIRYLSTLLKGLFGYGYYLAAPALLAMSAILVLHRGRPVRARTVCAALVPLFTGSLLHLFLSKESVEVDGIVKTLWASGLSLDSGGLLSGLLSVGLLALVGKAVSVILVLLIMVILVLVTFHVTGEKIAEKIRDRERVE